MLEKNWKQFFKNRPLTYLSLSLRKTFPRLIYLFLNSDRLVFLP